MTAWQKFSLPLSSTMAQIFRFNIKSIYVVNGMQHIAISLKSPHGCPIMQNKVFPKSISLSTTLPQYAKSWQTFRLQPHYYIRSINLLHQTQHNFIKLRSCSSCLSDFPNAFTLSYVRYLVHHKLSGHVWGIWSGVHNHSIFWNPSTWDYRLTAPSIVLFP